MLMISELMPDQHTKPGIQLLYYIFKAISIYRISLSTFCKNCLVYVWDLYWKSKQFEN